jgi:hypothetical protein
VRCWFPCETKIITFASFNHIQFLLSTSQYCVYQKWLRTLANVVVVDATQTYLFLGSCTIQRFVVFDAIQVKEKSYYNRHPTNQFFLLEIEVFGYLHKHVVFLHNYANAIWSLKGTKGFHLFTLVTFLCQKC